VLPASKAPTAQDLYSAMLRRGAVPAAIVGALALVVFTVVDGGAGAAGSLLATAVVLVFSATTLLLLRRTVGLDPRVVFLAAMIGYFTKVGLLGVFLVLFRSADWLSPLAFAVTAIAVSLASTVGEIVAFTRTRTLIYDEPPAAGAQR
jgi:ATP synthase protein I